MDRIDELRAELREQIERLEDILRRHREDLDSLEERKVDKPYER